MERSRAESSRQERLLPNGADARCDLRRLRQNKTRQSRRLARLYVYMWCRGFNLGRFLQAANAGGAKTLGNRLATFHDLHFLDVDVPAAAGRLARPRAVVTKLRAAATTLTLRHDEAPFTQLLTAQLTHSIWLVARERDSLVTQLE